MGSVHNDIHTPLPEATVASRSQRNVKSKKRTTIEQVHTAEEEYFLKALEISYHLRKTHTLHPY